MSETQNLYRRIDQVMASNFDLTKAVLRTSVERNGFRKLNADLLEALKQIAAIADRESTSIHDEQVKRYSTEAIDIARAAIAQAEALHARHA